MAADQAKEWGELISAYLDGELDEAVRAEVEAHLEHDAQAGRLLSELREARAMLQDLPREQAPGGILGDVMERAARRPPDPSPARLGAAPHWLRWQQVAAAAAVLLLLVLPGSWLIWRTRGKERMVFSNVSVQRKERAAPAAVGEPAVEDGLAYAPSKRGPALKGGGPKKGGRPSKSDARVAPAPPQRPSSPDDLTRADASRAHIGQGASGTPPAEGPQQEQQKATTALGQRGEMDETFQVLEAPAEVGWRVAAQQQGNFVQLLKEGQPASTLASYEFAGEPVELTCSFASDAERDHFAQQTEMYFARNGLVNVADPSQRADVTDPDRQDLYLPGEQGVNFTASGSRQYLVSAPPHALEALMTDLQEALPESVRSGVQLQVGTASAQGFDRAHTVAGALPRWYRGRMLSKDGGDPADLDDDLLAFAGLPPADSEAPGQLRSAPAMKKSREGEDLLERRARRKTEVTAADRLGQVAGTTTPGSGGSGGRAAGQVQSESSEHSHRGGGGGSGGGGAVFGDQPATANVTFVLNLVTRPPSEQPATQRPD